MATVTLTWRGRLQLAQVAREARLLDEKTRREIKEAQRQRRIALWKEIYAASNIYEEISNRLRQLRQDAAEAYPGELEHCWELLPLALDEVRIAEAEYIRAFNVEEIPVSGGGYSRALKDPSGERTKKRKAGGMPR